MEALMQINLARSVMAGCALAGVTFFSSAAVAQWHTPSIYHEAHDGWTNVSYDDGVCRYKFTRNAYDQQTHVDRWGDCSHIVIGADGSAIPVQAMAPAIYVAPRY
jgi:hypothetical protein